MFNQKLIAMTTETMTQNQTDELFLINTYDRSGVGGDEFRYIIVWNNTKKIIEHLQTYAWTCFGEGGTEYTTKPMNAEMQILADDFRTSQFNASVDKQLAECNKEISAFNEAKPYQSKGQTVEVFKGKNKGFVGVAFWEGQDTFKRSGNSLNFNQSTILAIISTNVTNASKFDRIGIKDASGKAIFTSTDNCRVINGFQPISITREKVAEIVKRRNANFDAFFNVR